MAHHIYRRLCINMGFTPNIKDNVRCYWWKFHENIFTGFKVLAKIMKLGDDEFLS